MSPAQRACVAGRALSEPPTSAAGQFGRCGAAPLPQYRAAVVVGLGDRVQLGTGRRRQTVGQLALIVVPHDLFCGPARQPRVCESDHLLGLDLASRFGLVVSFGLVALVSLALAAGQLDCQQQRYRRQPTTRIGAQAIDSTVAMLAAKDTMMPAANAARKAYRAWTVV
jgi:hypothetical protein